MASVNRVILIGNLGHSPVERTMPDGRQIATASMATNEKRADSTHTEWHRLEFPPELQARAVDSLKRGAGLYIEGALRTRKHTNRQKQEVTTLWVVVSDFHLLHASEPRHESA